MWRCINEIIYNKHNSHSTIRAIRTADGTITTNVNQMANQFNGFFCDIGKSLHDILVNTSQANMHSVPNSETPIERSMFLWNANEEEVAHKIRMLKNSNSLNDFISSNTLKSHSHLLTPTLCKLINDSFLSGVFPIELKTSRIVPIFKDGDPLATTNYRPISILLSFSKVIESILYDRIFSFLRKNQCINANQFGFQKQSGTLSAAATLIDLLQTKLDEKKTMLHVVFSLISKKHLIRCHIHVF